MQAEQPHYANAAVGQWLIYHKMWGGGVLGACSFFCVQALPEAIYGMIIP